MAGKRNACCRRWPPPVLSGQAAGCRLRLTPRLLCQWPDPYRQRWLPQLGKGLHEQELALPATLTVTGTGAPAPGGLLLTYVNEPRPPPRASWASPQPTVPPPMSSAPTIQNL